MFFLVEQKQKNPIRIGLWKSGGEKKKSICEPAKKGSCFRDAASYYILLKDHEDIFSSELCPLINCAWYDQECVLHAMLTLM